MAEPKSFYIFDFDGNILHTGSKTFLYHKESGEPLALDSTEFAFARTHIGKQGPYKDYWVDASPMRSFQAFNDYPEFNHYPFLETLKQALQKPGWEGPSWARFVKAVSRERTIAIITARGHHPDEMKKGFLWLAEQKLIPKPPLIHTIYAVTHPATKQLIRWTGPDFIAAMKKQALHHFIEAAYGEFGHEPPHRFGFSDDDPQNIISTRQKFRDLKTRNPHHGFFLYEAGPKEVREEEVLLSHCETH